MLKFQKIEKKKKNKKQIIYRIFINKSYGCSPGNMIDALSGEQIFKDDWIEVERQSGKFMFRDSSLINKKGNWVTDNTEIGFCGWDDSVKNLDNSSDEMGCFDISSKLMWDEVLLTPRMFSAPNIERLCEALEHINICGYCPGDI